MGLVTRFAPAPTGWLHLGHVVSALHVWTIARERGARVILRIEDHDRTRCREEYVDGIVEDLAWLGFVPDATAPRQSSAERAERYAAALAALESAGVVYTCDCSRREIAVDVPDVFGEETRYPGRCRTRALAGDSTSARRVRMEPGDEMFTDERLGAVTQSPADQCGDFLVRDRLGNWTYQFAVVVDDLDQGVDLVIRGEDLLSSTARQIRLGRLLGRAAPPTFHHHALVRNPDGSKLSKSAGDTSIRELRRAGKTAAEALLLAQGSMTRRI
ncbi:MAG TPA: glutamate--tRNA ligase family protein [Gemmatimonadaceae bacterium]